jgi:hypothetical protein
MEGEHVSTIITATDPDEPANNFVFSLDAVSLSLGMTMDPSTGEFQWLPGEDAGGSVYTVTATVADDGEPVLSANIAFLVTVHDVNSAPAFAGLSDQTADENSPFEYAIIAMDEDLPANNLIFSLDDQAPNGMQIGVTTGLLSWTPNEEQGGEQFLVTVTVTDDGVGRLYSTGSFNITVTETASVPTMAPQSYTIDELTELRFDVQASDRDIPPEELSYSLDQASLSAGLCTVYLLVHTSSRTLPHWCTCVLVHAVLACSTWTSVGAFT